MVELNEKNQPEIITEWIPISITDHDQIMSGATPETYMGEEEQEVITNIVETILVENNQKHEA